MSVFNLREIKPIKSKIKVIILGKHSISSLCARLGAYKMNFTSLFFYRPRVLPIPGADLENVFTLRTPDDANKISENIGGKNVVIVGSSFIGECPSGFHVRVMYTPLSPTFI